MRYSNIDLVWRPDRGWCVTMTGPQGETGYLIPILDYINGLHAFFAKPGTPFGMASTTKLIEGVVIDAKRITRRRKTKRRAHK